MKEQATDEIQEKIESFYNGEPQHIEVEIAEGVFFSSDNPFEDDLMEPLMTASILIDPDSPHNKGIPEDHTTVSDYSVKGDELMADVICRAVHKAGGEFRELIFEYSPSNSNEVSGFLVFLGSIPNNRVFYNWQSQQTEVRSEYAI